MMKKLTVNTIAKSSLRNRKKQYMLMIVGIIFAMFFSSAVLFLTDSMKTSTDVMHINAYGKQDAVWVGCNEEQIEKVKDAKAITSYGFAHYIGFGYNDEKNEGYSGVSIAWLDNNAKELSNITFIEGGYPQKENEIALEQTVARKWVGDEAKIGDKITVTVMPKNASGYLEKTVEKTYTLVGIAENKRDNLSAYNISVYGQIDDAYPGAFVSQNSATEIGGKQMLSCYFTTDLNWSEFYKAAGVDGTACINWMEAMNLLDFSGYNSFMLTSFLSAVLVLVLLTASCMGIISSMSNSLNERKKQIGMLRTVGATRRQIINIFGREALIICLICTPISVLLSYLCVKLMISFMGENFVFAPKWQILVLCAAVGIVCVMLSALIPLFKASRISPIQSIRNIDMTRTMKTKRIKTQKSYDMAKLLAKRNIIFTKKSQISASIFLIITLLGAGVGFSFSDYMISNGYHKIYDYTLQSEDIFGYDLAVNYTNGIGGYTEAELQQIKSNINVKSVDVSMQVWALLSHEHTDYIKTLALGGMIFAQDFYNSFYNSNGSITPDNFDEKLVYSKDYIEHREKYNGGKDFYDVAIVKYTEEEIEKMSEYVFDGRINIDKLNSGEQVIVCAPKEVAYKFIETKRYIQSGFDLNDNISDKINYLKRAKCDLNAGDMLDLSIITALYDPSSETDLPEIESRIDKTVEIGAITSKLFSVDDKRTFEIGNIEIITTEEGLRKLCPWINTYGSFSIMLKDECTDEIDAEMQKMLSVISDKHDGYLYSEYEYAKQQREEFYVTSTALFSVIILFLAISIVIINNSLTTRIRESKREIGTMRAVGASQKVIVMSFIRQLFATLSTSCIISFVLLFIAIIVRIIFEKFLHIEVAFRISILPSLIVCLILFAVCSFNLYLKIRKETKNSIIDNIREL